MPISKLWRITLDTNPEDCNYQCIMCEEHSPYSHFKQELKAKEGISKRRMPPDWLPDIFAQAKQLGVREIIPSTMGEPLLYRHFDDIIRLARETNIQLNLTTNGSFPGKSAEQWAKELIPVTRDIKISWNGAGKTSQEAIMQGSNFDAMIQALDTLIAYRNHYWQAHGHYCSLSLQLTFMQSNVQEVPEIIRMAAERGIDRVKGHHVWTHFPEIEPLSLKRSSESIALWNASVRQAQAIQQAYSKPDGNTIQLEHFYPISSKGELQEVPQSYVCPFLGKELWIAANGKISPCCAPDDQRQQLGDLGYYPNVSLREVLESPTYKHLVAHYKEYALCKQCNMRIPP